MKLAVLLLPLPLLVCSGATHGPLPQEGPGGAVIVRVPDAVATRCIAPRQDQIWLTLRRVVSDRSRGWFSEDQSVAVLVDAAVQTYPPGSRPISFPLMAEATLRGYSEGQVSIPVEYTIVSGLPLMDEDLLYSGLSVEMTLLNRRGRNGWGRALEALAETADKLPIPASPATQTASYLLDFANRAVARDVEDLDDGDKVRSAALALNFDPSGACASGSSDFEETGTLAVLHERGIRGPDYVPLADVNDRCWAADFRPSFVLKAAPRRTQVPCGDPSYEAEYRPVTNNYVGFFLNAVPRTGVLGPDAEEERGLALARCRAHGIAPTECF